jgi:hypothetical protein
MRYLSVLFLVSVLSVNAWGQQIAAWNLTSTTTTPTATDGKLTGSAITVGPSGTISYQASPGDIYCSSWSTSATFSTAGKYWQFSITPDSGYKITIASLTFKAGTTNTGPQKLQVQYSLDGFLTSGTVALGETANTSTSSLSMFALSTLPPTITSTITFRIWGYAASSTGNFRLNNIVVNGEDHPLPVTMKGITAKVEAGKVCLSISTASEGDVVGFNISRSISKDGPFQLISSYISNPALRTSGSTTSGGSYSFVDAKVYCGKTYFYKVESVEKSGESKQVGEVLQVNVAVPKDFAVYQNYPNPFNPTTNIRFDLKSDASVTVEVYNALGAKVKSMSGGTMSAGTREITVDMSRMASGVYYYKFIAMDNIGKSFVKTERMMLMK